MRCEQAWLWSTPLLSCLDWESHSHLNAIQDMEGSEGLNYEVLRTTQVMITCGRFRDDDGWEGGKDFCIAVPRLSVLDEGSMLGNVTGAGESDLGWGLGDKDLSLRCCWGAGLLGAAFASTFSVSCSAHTICDIEASHVADVMQLQEIWSAWCSVKLSSIFLTIGGSIRFVWQEQMLKTDSHETCNARVEYWFTKNYVIQFLQNTHECIARRG